MSTVSEVIVAMELLEEEGYVVLNLSQVARLAEDVRDCIVQDDAANVWKYLYLLDCGDEVSMDTHVAVLRQRDAWIQECIRFLALAELFAEEGDTKILQHTIAAISPYVSAVEIEQGVLEVLKSIRDELKEAE